MDSHWPEQKGDLMKKAGECNVKKMCTESATGGHKRATLALENIGLDTESASEGH